MRGTLTFSFVRRKPVLKLSGGVADVAQVCNLLYRRFEIGSVLHRE
jgi:hypothetical protein